MRYKKLTNDPKPDNDNNNYITVNTKTETRDIPNLRIISLFWKGKMIIEGGKRYYGYRYVDWFKI